jgi:hypothetical protein
MSVGFVWPGSGARALEARRFEETSKKDERIAPCGRALEISEDPLF